MVAIQVLAQPSLLSAIRAWGCQRHSTKSIRGARDANSVRATRASVGSLGAVRHTNRAKTARRPVGSPSAANSSTTKGGAQEFLREPYGLPLAGKKRERRGRTANVSGPMGKGGVSGFCPLKSLDYFEGKLPRSRKAISARTLHRRVSPD